MAKKKKKKKKKQPLSFWQEIGRVVHQKGTEIAIGLITGIVTNYMTDASEKIMAHFTKPTAKPPANKKS